MIDIANEQTIEVDWKFTAADLLENAEQLVGKIGIEYTGEREVDGVWYDVVRADGKEYTFPSDNSPESLELIMELINRHIPDKHFEYYPSDGDSHRYKLVSGGGSVITKREVPEIPRTTPATSKHFILYRIQSINPATRATETLVFGEGTQYASKVNPGETLTQVIDREIVDLTGSKEYTLHSATEHDEAKDRFGNSLKRYLLMIEVPYFNPESRTLKYPAHWI